MEEFGDDIESSNEFLQTRDVGCPWCGQSIELIVDTWAGPQQYVEDCEVCCRPIVITIRIDHEGDPWIEAIREND